MYNYIFYGYVFYKFYEYTSILEYLYNMGKTVNYIRCWLAKSKKKDEDYYLDWIVIEN